jgi:hypothetical protein
MNRVKYWPIFLQTHLVTLLLEACWGRFPVTLPTSFNRFRETQTRLTQFWHESFASVCLLFSRTLRPAAAFHLIFISWPGLPDGVPIYKPKIPFWVNFGGSCNRRCLYILWPFGIFYCLFVNFMTIWYVL